MIEEANKKWSECLVGYKSFLSMLLIAHPILYSEGLTKVIYHEDGFHFLRFFSDDARRAVLEGGHWLFCR